MRSLKDLNSSDLLDQFLDQAEGLAFSKSKKKTPILDWTKSIILGTRPFQIEGHEYEIDMLTCEAPIQCYKKGAQMGVTEINVLKSMHGLIFSKYPAGVLYLFPTNLDVSDFSKGRFGALIRDNPKKMQAFVQDTDSVAIKRVQRAFLYLRGARSTTRIEGIQKTSSQLRSIPINRLVCDESDLFEPAMIDLARERLSHSEIKEESYLSTPSIPDYGISKLYDESDQRVWMIRCEHCGSETCLELEFPYCLLELSSGQVIRVCKKCQKEIFPKNGHWVAQYPQRSKDLVGWWISQLNSVYVSPGKILKAFRDPPNRNLAEVYNSKLGMAYISADNRLTVNDVYSGCGQDAMAMNHRGPCGMGVDVGSLLNVVIGFKPKDKVQVCYVARVSSFNDVHDIAQRFNVKFAVIDMEPELRKAREFQAGEPYRVFLCDYIDSVKTGPVWDEDKMIVKVNRTEVCDTTHDLVTSPALLILPKRDEELEIFAKQVSNMAKVLQEDQETGSREYRYRKLGEDHYRHALNYFYLASTRSGVLETLEEYDRRRLYESLGIPESRPYNPFTYGMDEATATPGGYNPFSYGLSGDEYNPRGRG
jgi:hypothetical protein